MKLINELNQALELLNGLSFEPLDSVDKTIKTIQDLIKEEEENPIIYSVRKNIIDDVAKHFNDTGVEVTDELVARVRDCLDNNVMDEEMMNQVRFVMDEFFKHHEEKKPSDDFKSSTVKDDCIIDF